MKPGQTMHRRLRFLLFAWVLQALAPASVTFAANRLAVKFAAEAEKASEAGDFKKAVELYGEAWRADPHPEILLMLARAEHQAGEFDKALEHYHGYLDAPNGAADRVAQARAYVDQIERMRLDARVQQLYLDAFQRGQIDQAQLRASEGARELALLQEADSAARAGDDKKAARLYFGVYRAARDRDDALLFKAAVAEEYAHRWHEAAALLEEYVKRAPSTAPSYSEAVTRLESLRRRLGSSVVTVQQPSPVKVKPVMIADAPKDGDPATIGWTLVKVGAAVALIGLGSYVWTLSEQADLNAQLQLGANGKIHDISREAALERQQSINAHVVTSVVFGGVGVAAAGVGTWFILRSPSRVAITPGPAPASVAVSWRF